MIHTGNVFVVTPTVLRSIKLTYVILPCAFAFRYVAGGFGRIATTDYNASSTDVNVHISNIGDATKRMSHGMKPEDHFVSFSNISAALAKEYG